MTRSEAIQEAITYFDTEAGFAKEDAELMERCGPFDKLAVFVAKHKRADEFFNNTIKSILLAEQKRSDGCGYCNDPKILEIQIETGFDYCPHCGRDLTEGKSE